MKGILKKTEQGWMVVYSKPGPMTFKKGLPIESTFELIEYPLHPVDNNLMVFRGQLPNDQHMMDGMEISFDLTRFCTIHNSDPSRNSVCTIDCAYDEVYYAKLTNQNHLPINSNREFAKNSSPDMTMGFVEGLNDAKEILYSQEEVEKLMYWTAKMVIGKIESGLSHTNITDELNLKFESIKKSKNK